jgi:hypothetical protein
VTSQRITGAEYEAALASGRADAETEIGAICPLRRWQAFDSTHR